MSIMSETQISAMALEKEKDEFSNGDTITIKVRFSLTGGLRDSFTEEDLDEFLDSLSSEQFEKVKQFFDTIPKLSHTAKYTCKTCGEEKETTIEGLNSFFG